MPDQATGWTFAIVGSDDKHITKFIGFTDTYDGALEYQRNMTNIGWRNVRIYDASLQLVTNNSNG
jgi:hypothetical protein